MKQIVLVIFLFAALCAHMSCKKMRASSRPSAYDYRSTGMSARDILRSEPYGALEVQIQYMPGYKLEPETIQAITELLERVCDKPDGINISQSQVNLSADTISLDKVMDIEKRYRLAYTSNNTMVLYVLITDGYSDKDGIAAFTYYNTSIVIFGGMISRFADRGKVHMETFLLTHELGHIMGLTNMGTPMQVPHEDSMLIHHCTTPTCAMSQGPTNTQLDSLCLQDLAALRNGK